MWKHQILLKLNSIYYSITYLMCALVRCIKYAIAGSALEGNPALVTQRGSVISEMVDSMTANMTAATVTRTTVGNQSASERIPTGRSDDGRYNNDDGDDNSISGQPKLPLKVAAKKQLEDAGGDPDGSNGHGHWRSTCCDAAVTRLAWTAIEEVPAVENRGSYVCNHGPNSNFRPPFLATQRMMDGDTD